MTSHKSWGHCPYDSLLFYANSLIVIEFCHDSIKKINFLYFRCSKN